MHVHHRHSSVRRGSLRRSRTRPVAAYGRARVHIGPHGCRAFPTGTHTVELDGSTLYTTDDVPRYETIFVSDTGRTLVLTHERNLRADRASITVFRDGRRFGNYAISNLVGDRHHVVTERRFVEVSIDGLALVIDDVDGTNLYRHHVGVLRRQ